MLDRGNKLKDELKRLIEQGQLEHAKAILEEYKKRVAHDIEIYSILGVMAIMEGKLDEAEKHLLTGLEHDAENFDLLYNLGYLYTAKADPKALQYYKMARDAAKTPEQKNDTAVIISDLESRQAAPESQRINHFFDSPLDGETLSDFARKDHNKIGQDIQKKIRNGEYGAAIAICHYWLTQIDENNASVNYCLALAANGIDDFDNALKYHKKALEIDNGLADIKHRKSKYQYTYNEKQVNCIGCGHENFAIVNISNQSISEDNKELINPIRIWVKCNRCGLIYANPMPAEDSLNQYYSIIAKEKFGGIYGNIDDRFEFLVSMANRRLEKIERYAGGVKTLLDIGTGIGTFTGTALDRGWRAEGLELTQEDCQYAKEKFALELIHENFYSFQEDRTYDVVTLFEVIEHLQKPLADLRQINKLVKDNGILVVSTPIQDTLFGKKMKENNIFWHVTAHLSYFTKDVMIDYLKEAGFEIMEICGSNEGGGRMEFYCRKR